MGCSDAWDYVLPPKEAQEVLEEEKRRTKVRIEIGKVKLSKFTLDDLISVLNVMTPSYPYRIWRKQDTDFIEKLLKKLK